MITTKEFLEQYSGLLDADKIAEGINAAIKNSDRLYKDAALLYNMERYPSSLSLAILSIEELGKIPILRGLALAEDEKEAKIEWKRYRAHRAKNGHWIFLDLIRQGAPQKLDSFAACVNEKSEHTAFLDALKQAAFYTDCVGEKMWSLPENHVSKDLVVSVMDIASIFQKEQIVTTREIELWIKHLQHNKESRRGLVCFFEEMIEEGLWDTSLEDVKSFVYNDTTASSSS